MNKKMVLLLALLWLLTIPQTALAADQKLIAITFDDGPSKYTSGLLDELAKRQAVVTFFMQGVNAERYQSVVQKAYAAGHQIASHTYNHPILTNLSADERQRQLSRTTSILNAATGAENIYMLRPPYGSYNAQVLAQIGVPAILWSVDTRDWESRNANAVYQNIVSKSRDGSIVLLHDLYPSTIEGALRGIDYLQAQGYELVTVRELLRRRGIEPAAGKTYSSVYPNGVNLPGIAAPQISYDPTSGLLTLTTETAGAAIYYSLNGSTLTVYHEPLNAAVPLEVTALAALDLNGARSRQAHLLISDLGNYFADIQRDSWYYEDVDRIVTTGLLTTDNGYFYPDEIATEETAAILIQRLTGSQPANASASRPLTRQTLAQLLYQTANPNNTAGTALDWISSQGIYTGDFRPTDTVTRAELAAITLRFIG